MEKNPIYTIGHGARKIEDFLALLNKYSIEYVIDVRTQPYSKFYPHFNQNELKHFLERKNIKYVFMGDALGGRPKDDSCRNYGGKVDYEILKNKDFFVAGIERLKTAFSKNLVIAIMCSESNPCECHRSKLIGKVLLTDKINLMHIDEHGKLKDQPTIINELNKGKSDFDLFGNQLNATSRKAYL